MLLSLDLAKAFDYCMPRLAIRCLERLGLNRQTTSLCSLASENQQQLLQLGMDITSCPIAVNQSLPQGDAFSPMALNAIMVGPTRSVERTLQATEAMATYLDDHTFVCKTAERANDTMSRWQEWGKQMGWKENVSKTKVVVTTRGNAKQKAKKTFGTTMVQNTRVLGIDFGSRTSPTATARVQEAGQRLRRIKHFPGGFVVKRQLVKTTVMSLESWRWWRHDPPKHLGEKLRVSIGRALLSNAGWASKDLGKILRGHDTDLGFAAGTCARPTIGQRNSSATEPRAPATCSTTSPRPRHARGGGELQSG